MSELNADERFVEINGVDVRYFVAGPEEGRPVVLLHGGGMDAAAVSWKETVPRVADQYRVYAVDLPGYGGSGPVPKAATPDTGYYIEVLSAFLTELDLIETTLVGISKGGAIALGYTLESPARVSRLVLVASYGLGPKIPGGKLGAAYVKAPKALAASWWLMRRSRRMTRASIRAVVHPANYDESLLEDAVRELQRPNAGDAFQRFQRAEVGWSGSRTNYADQMEELPVPTLFVHGDSDSLVPPAYSKAASDAAPVAERFMLNDCGHWVPRELPDAFVTRLELWLER